MLLSNNSYGRAINRSFHHINVYSKAVYRNRRKQSATPVYYHNHNLNLNPNILFSRQVRQQVRQMHNSKHIAQKSMPNNKSQNSRGNYKQSQSSSQPSSIPSLDTFIITLASRILAGFGILHIVSEYCFEMTRCEGPSMMPTIQANGEIILVEKMTHRIYGLDGGDDAMKRAQDSRSKQLDWEKKERKLWLEEGLGKGIKCGHLAPSSLKKGNGAPTTTPTTTPTSTLVHTWYKSKQKEVNKDNYNYLSSWSQCVEKVTSGICVGDVIVLQHPDRNGTVCKRVLGLPGDMILRPKSNNFKYTSGSISHNSASRKSSFQQQENHHRAFISMFHDDLKQGENENMNIDQHNSPTSSATSLTNSSLTCVPNGHIWVEGDNSINSSDSRTYGPVPASFVVGKVWMRLWHLRGCAMMVRGSCPIPRNGSEFSGSTPLHAGYEGEIIIERN